MNAGEDKPCSHSGSGVSFVKSGPLYAYNELFNPDSYSEAGGATPGDGADSNTAKVFGDLANESPSEIIRRSDTLCIEELKKNIGQTIEQEPFINEKRDAGPSAEVISPTAPSLDWYDTTRESILLGVTTIHSIVITVVLSVALILCIKSDINPFVTVALISALFAIQTNIGLSLMRWVVMPISYLRQLARCDDSGPTAGIELLKRLDRFLPKAASEPQTMLLPKVASAEPKAMEFSLPYLWGKIRNFFTGKPSASNTSAPKKRRRRPQGKASPQRGKKA